MSGAGCGVDRGCGLWISSPPERSRGAFIERSRGAFIERGWGAFWDEARRDLLAEGGFARIRSGERRSV